MTHNSKTTLTNVPVEYESLQYKCSPTVPQFREQMLYCYLQLVPFGLPLALASHGCCCCWYSSQVWSWQYLSSHIKPLCAKPTLVGPFINICQRIHLSCRFSYTLCAKPLWLVRPLKKLDVPLLSLPAAGQQSSQTLWLLCSSSSSSSSLSSSYSFLSLSLTPWSLVSSRLKLSDCLIGEQLSGASLQLMRPPFHDDDDEDDGDDDWHTGP